MDSFFSNGTAGAGAPARLPANDDLTVLGYLPVLDVVLLDSVVVVLLVSDDAGGVPVADPVAEPVGPVEPGAPDPVVSEELGALLDVLPAVLPLAGGVLGAGFVVVVVVVVDVLLSRPSVRLRSEQAPSASAASAAANATPSACVLICFIAAPVSS